MNDQASSLRLLKAMVDKHQPEPAAPEDFLQEIVRPAPFTSVALIWPDDLIADFRHTTGWISALMQSSSRACFWDQAKMMPENAIPRTQIRLKHPTPVRIEAGMTPLSVMPSQPVFPEIYKAESKEKIDFLRHIIRSLKAASEVWISIKASELPQYHSILHATDAACIIIPQRSESMLRCYEIVKSIHLSGYFSPLGLLDFQHPEQHTGESVSNRIKIVAKQFLALDLVPAGMVLSNCTVTPPSSDINLRARLLSVESASKDFLYCLSEGLLYPIPGLF